MKKLLCFIFILFLTGCTATYDINVSKNSFKEKISFNVYNTEVNNDKNDTYAEYDNMLDSLFIDDFSSISDTYSRKITNKGEYSIVELKAKYDENSFSSSEAINSCFENYYINNKYIYEFSAYGEFYCLYSGNVDIRVKTFNKVLSNNADEKKGHTYIWHITEDNKDKIDIEIKIDKGKSINEIFSMILVAIAIITLAIVGLISYKKSKSEREI